MYFKGSVRQKLKFLKFNIEKFNYCKNYYNHFYLNLIKLIFLLKYENFDNSKIQI